MEPNSWPCLPGVPSNHSREANTNGDLVECSTALVSGPFPSACCSARAIALALSAHARRVQLRSMVLVNVGAQERVATHLPGTWHRLVNL